MNCSCIPWWIAGELTLSQYSLLHLLYSHFIYCIPITVTYLMYCQLMIRKLTSNLCSYILQCYFSLTRSQCSYIFTVLLIHDTTPPHTYVGFTTNIYRVMYRVRSAVCTVFCTQMSWVSNPSRMVSWESTTEIDESSPGT